MLLDWTRIVGMCGAFGLIGTSAATASAQRGVAAGPAPAAVNPGDLPVLAVTRFVLPNGLVVLLHEDHAAPIVTVDLWYHVGSKDEPPGRNGLAHVIEHVMSEQGTADVKPSELAKIIKGSGGKTDASTKQDWTQYVETVPSTYLETVLWLEADRMAGTFAGMSQSWLDTARAGVLNEISLRLDNGGPAGLENTLMGSTTATLFPVGHPYHGSNIGTPTEINTVGLRDARDFFHTFYVPNNAILVIAGALDPTATRKLVERYFGPVPRGTTVSRAPVPPPALAAEVRAVVEDARAHPMQLRFIWPAATTANADRPVLDVLASALTFDRTSRLRKALVYDRVLATSVTATNYDFEDGGLFQIKISAATGASLTDIERVVDSVLDEIKRVPLSAEEMSRPLVSNRVSAIVALQTDSAQADDLAGGELWFHDPRAMIADLARDAAVTPRDVQRVAAAYLTSRRIVMSVVPPGKLNFVSKPELPYINVTHAK